ncbi:MAG: acetylglutamate kinase [Candidatus Sumerlaeia bacterium]
MKPHAPLPLDKLIQRAEVLVEAIPYIREFRGSTAVIKYGGHAMIDDQLKQAVAQDIVLMQFVGIRPVVVHGGGPEITALTKRLGVQPQFVNGLRVTDQETLDVAEMVLAGKLNGEIVNLINRAGGRAVGLSGKDGHLILARKKTLDTGDGNERDLGFVGDVEKINPEMVRILEDNNFVPVIAPIGVDDKGQTLNINADTVAFELAIALQARKLILITDVKGIMLRPGDESSVVSALSIEEAMDLVQKKVISAGMIPKVEACVRAINSGLRKTHILDGRIPHALLLELFTAEGIGTVIAKAENL